MNLDSSLLRSHASLNQKGTIICTISYHPHSKLRIVTFVATKVHVILTSSIVLTWMYDNRETT